MSAFKVALTSYPGVDNKSTRKYIEDITKVVTGSDMLLDEYRVMASQLEGFKGEEIIDDRVWIVNTHHPW